jgi:hypothetical protein
LPALSREEGVAVHVVDEIGEVVVACCSLQADAPTEVRAHLRHASEYVLDPHANPADPVIARHFLDGQRVIARGFAHEEFLCVDLEQQGFVFLAVIGAVGEDGLVFFI